jgi:hypothetical protein
MSKINNMHAAIGQMLDDAERFFTKGVKLTFIARFDDNPEADVFISSDRVSDVSELVQRTLARERGEVPHTYLPATQEKQHG